MKTISKLSFSKHSWKIHSILIANPLPSTIILHPSPFMRFNTHLTHKETQCKKRNWHWCKKGIKTINENEEKIHEQYKQTSMNKSTANTIRQTEWHYIHANVQNTCSKKKTNHELLILDIFSSGQPWSECMIE